MSASSNIHTDPMSTWTSRVLFRTGPVGDYHWFLYPGEHEPRSAEVLAHRLRSEGLTVLVCTADEFSDVGLPQTYAADEYFRLFGVIR